MKQYKKIFFFIAIVLFLFACKKNKLSITTELVWNGTTTPMNKIVCITKDTCYCVGGERYSQGTFFSSVNGGNTWSEGLIHIKALYDQFWITSQKGFAVGFDGFVLSTNNAGSNWFTHPNNNWEQVYSSIFFVNDSIGFVAGGKGYDSGYIYKTENNGLNWEQKTFLNELKSISFQNELLGIAAGYGIVLKTTDGGNHWNATDANGDFFIHAKIFPNGVGYVVGQNGKILKTTNSGDSWKKVFNHHAFFSHSQKIRGMHFLNETTGCIVGDKGKIIITHDGGKKWSVNKKIIDEDWNSVFMTSNNTALGVTQQGNIYKIQWD